MRTLILSIACVTLTVHAAAAQEPKAQFVSAVADLGHESQARRQEAEKLLIAAGPEADRLLQGAIWSQDFAVRRRASRIIRQRRIGQVWEPTTAKYPGGEVPITDVTRHFARTFGGLPVSFFGLEYSLKNPPTVRIPAGDVPALQALADAADQLGKRIRYTRTMDRHALDWPSVPFTGCRNYVARSYSGPTMVELTSATQDDGTLHLEFHLLWEPRFELVSYSAEPLEYEITWSDGETSTLTIPVEWQVDRDWANSYRELKPIHASVNFDGVEPTKKIKRLKIKWPMWAAATVGKTIIRPVTPGEIVVTECETVNQFTGSRTEPAQFTRGYELAFGRSERKALSMALVDRALCWRELGEDDQGAPAQDEEFVLSHCDNIQSTGFLEHVKLPHYVDFQAELELVRRLRREAEALARQEAAE